MPVRFGLKKLAALLEEHVTDKISRSILSGKQGMHDGVVDRQGWRACRAPIAPARADRMDA